MPYDSSPGKFKKVKIPDKPIEFINEKLNEFDKKNVFWIINM